MIEVNVSLSDLGHLLTQATYSLRTAIREENQADTATFADRALELVTAIKEKNKKEKFDVQSR